MQQIDSSSTVQRIEELRFSLDASGKPIVVLHVDLFIFLVLFFGASIFEATGQRATPGKRLMVLRVSDFPSGQPRIIQTLARNFLKLLFLLFAAAQVYIIYVFMKDEYIRFFEQGGPLPALPSLIEQMLTYGFYTCTGITIIVFLSMFWPIKNMGRGLQDRLAGTVVEVAGLANDSTIRR